MGGGRSIVELVVILGNFVMKLGLNAFGGIEILSRRLFSPKW